MGRAPCCEKVGMKKGRWTAEEDEILVNYIKAHGEGSWRSLPKNAGLLRCGKSCRLRWMNYLRADLKKGNISQEEEQIIINLHVSVGNRWSLIAGHLPGRSDNEIKNYWNSHLSRRIHTFRKPGDGNPVIVDLGEGAAACKRRGGRTKRSAMKKTLINISTRREKYENSNTVLPASLPQCGGDDGMFIDKNSDQITTVNLAGVDVVLDPIGDTCPLVFKGEGLVGPSQGVENGRWGVEEMEGPLLGGGEDSEVLSSIEDRESGVMSSGEGREGGALASNQDRDCGSSGLEEGIEEELLASGEEFGSLQMDSMVDWELERIKEASKLWVEDEEVRPWLWEYENGEPDFQGLETIADNQEDSLASWFLSDVW